MAGGAVPRRKGWAVPKSFPSAVVFEAYLNPRVDTSRQPFGRSRPDQQLLRGFCRSKFGWSQVPPPTHPICPTCARITLISDQKIGKPPECIVTPLVTFRIQLDYATSRCKATEEVRIGVFLA